MNIERLTQKSQDGLRDAQTLALRRNHQGVDAAHLLAALLAQSEGVAPVLLERAGVAVADLRERIDRELTRIPQVAGPGTGGTPYVTQRLAKLFAQAETEAGTLKDEYVSVEHLVLAMLEEVPMKTFRPPVAPKIPYEMTTHGDTRVDHYHWMREKTNPKVI